MYVKLRNHFEKIIELTDSEFEFIKARFKPKKLKKHQFLIQEGDIVYQDYYVTKGLLRAYYNDANGKEHILQFAMEDWWISDFQAYYNQSPATLNIECLEEVEVLGLSLENRTEICNQYHKVEHFFRVKANNGYVALQMRILSFLKDSPKERYNKFSNLYPNLIQRIPKTLLASYLGVTRETLSRISV